MSKKILWLTTTSMNIEPVMGSLDSLELCETVHVPFDQTGRRFFDGELLEHVGRVQPDCVFYIGSLEGPYLARSQVFHDMREFCPVVNFVFDGGCPNGWPTLKRYREEKAFTLTINIDGNQDWPKGENDITTLCPVDPRPYEKERPKTISFGFYGGSTSEDRAQILSALDSEKLIVTGERLEEIGTYHIYADFMKECSMVLNMAKTGSGRAMHVKARVVEAGLAKCCLLEPKGSPTQNWFEPGTDYVEYSNLNDLISIVRELKRSPEAVEDFAESLHAKVTTQHSPEIFYEKVFSKIGMTL